MKLGQQKTHVQWHRGCIESGEETEAEFWEKLAAEEIICDGSTLGTVEAMRVCSIINAEMVMLMTRH